MDIVGSGLFCLLFCIDVTLFAGGLETWVGFVLSIGEAVDW